MINKISLCYFWLHSKFINKVLSYYFASAKIKVLNVTYFWQINKIEKGKYKLRKIIYAHFFKHKLISYFLEISIFGITVFEYLVSNIFIHFIHNHNHKTNNLDTCNQRHLHCSIMSIKII